MASVGEARAFFSAHCGIPLDDVAHYVTVVEDAAGDMAALETCCDGVGDAQRMLAGALTVLTGKVPLAPYSTAVIVQRDDLRAVLKAELPEEVRGRFLEALREAADDA